MKRSQYTLVVASLFLPTIIYAQIEQLNLDTSYRCLYTQLHFIDPIYAFQPIPEVEQMIDDICRAANVPKDFSVHSATIPSVALVKDSLGYHLLYSASYARQLLRQDPNLLFLILAHEIGHRVRKDRLDGQSRIREEFSADEFMGRVLLHLSSFDSRLQLVNLLKTIPYAYSKWHPAKRREEAVSNGWKVSEGLLKSKSNLAFFEEKTVLENLPLPLFKRRGCPRSRPLPAHLFTGCKKLKDVDSLLTTALQYLGYEQHSYFYLKHGFALLTSIEQIAADGKPLVGMERWQEYPATGKIDGIWEYLTTLFIPQPGYFRMFVFLVTDEQVQQDSGQITHEEARAWLQSGEFNLPASVGAAALSEGHQISVLVYEFEATQTIKKMQERCMGENILPIDDHLRRSGILSALMEKP